MPQWKAVELKWPVSEWGEKIEGLEVDGWLVHQTHTCQDGLIVILMRRRGAKDEQDG